MKEVVSSQGIDRLILFLKTLDAFANTKEYDLLSMLGYENSVDLADAERINTVMNLVVTNYSEEIKYQRLLN